MEHLGINVNVKNVPELDAGYIPLHKFNAAFLEGAEKPLGIAVERAGGEVAVMRTFIHGTPEFEAADSYYADRMVKSMLWLYGGWKVYISGDRDIYERIRAAYTPDGSRAFDEDFMSGVYERPFDSVEEAVALRLEHPEAQIIAGGSDVLVQMREGKRAGAELISIYGIDAMRGICIDEDENIRIGSLTSFSHITRDPIIRKYINVLGEAVDMVGGPQIRNIGTIGGNTCNGVTSADSASTLHAWEAIVELTGKNGVRRLPIKDFYLRAGKVDIRAEEGEIQTAILIPKASYENCFGHYIKYAMRNAMDIATTGCSVNVVLSEDKKHRQRHL